MSRREKLEEMLKDDPNDPFLQYALANEDLNDGATAVGIERLESLIASSPDYVGAYFRLGQVFATEARRAEAGQILNQGIATAEREGDQHAASEMRQLLSELSINPD